MGIIENLFNFGLFVKSLALNKVVRYCTCRAILLQCAATHSEYLGEFLISQEPLIVQCRLYQSLRLVENLVYSS